MRYLKYNILHNTPNLLSLTRIFLSPLFLYFLKGDHRVIAGIIFLLGAITDFLDGFVARKFNITSKIGEILDPLSDKIFMNTVLWGIVLYLDNLPYSIFCIALLLSFRDIILIFGAIFIILKKIKVEIKPIYLSKICTTLIFILLFFVIISENLGNYIDILSYTCLFLVILTSIFYIRRFFKRNNKF